MRVEPEHDMRQIPPEIPLSTPFLLQLGIQLLCHLPETSPGTAEVAVEMEVRIGTSWAKVY
ncbi:hypothetical protein [Nitrosococcus wardiae]|uniref:Uncharacterized protein n=1 Tax=Nitrosococcus wardiae TaxID=1814290 RepID=A0A4P7BY87_9GAMM|nr:hypothetical protein [Nitrosococcus wardiae]QBQ53366.1 hypothetical protein E3U44_01725 [Nitrosococcus wardiae]